MEKCKNCKFYHVYYMGCVDGVHRFSHVCDWEAKRDEKINPDECHVEVVSEWQR